MGRKFDACRSNQPARVCRSSRQPGDVADGGPGQQIGAFWRIGFLTPRSLPISPNRDPFSDAFTRGMNHLGYSEGKNLVVEWRYADEDYTWACTASRGARL